MKFSAPWLFLTIGLATTAIACGDVAQLPPQSAPPEQSRPVSNSGAAQAPVAPTQKPLPDGKYPLQQATYDDGDGLYTAMILNAPPGFGSLYRQENLPMARLTEEEIKAGEKSYLKVENGQPALYLTEDFKIEYVHNVVEQQENPATGQREQVVVRQEPSFWSPFAGSLAGSLAGQAIGSMLFRPQYYVPPQYSPGREMVGYGSYGNSYREANDRYRERYRELPAAERNRTVFRTAGRQRPDRLKVQNPNGNSLNRNSNNSNSNSNNNSQPRQTQPAQTQPSGNSQTGDRSTGSGYGSSNLRPSKRSQQYSKPSTPQRSQKSGFGSGRRRR
jgi:hypothetical protein